MYEWMLCTLCTSSIWRPRSYVHLPYPGLNNSIYTSMYHHSIKKHDISENEKLSQQGRVLFSLYRKIHHNCIKICVLRALLLSNNINYPRTKRTKYINIYSTNSHNTCTQLQIQSHIHLYSNFPFPQNFPTKTSPKHTNPMIFLNLYLALAFD